MLWVHQRLLWSSYKWTKHSTVWYIILNVYSRVCLWFLAAGLPANAICQYYSRRSPPRRSRMFTPLPVMSVNGTIFLNNHTCLILFKLFQTCFAQSYMFKLVQTFSNLFKSIQTCSNLSKLVLTCPNFLKLVQTCSKLLYFVQTCSNMLKLVQTSLHFIQLVQDCPC